MGVLIDLPPAVVQEVRQYAESRGTTLNCLLRDYLSDLVRSRGRARLMGAASEYVKPGLRAREKGAFARAMERKHAAAR